MYKRGFTQWVIIGIIALIAIGGWVFLRGEDKSTTPAEQDEMMQDGEGLHDAVEDGDILTTAITETKDTETPDTNEGDENAGGSVAPAYTGELLAGSLDTSPLLAFGQADYEAALASGNTVILWYYATWCPTCQLEQREITAAFDQWNKPGLVGFRVNINDNDTDKFEEATAREFGVAYRHVKIGIKNGERVLKTPETWNTARYLEEFRKLNENRN